MKIQGSKKSSGSRHCNITFIWQFRAIVYISLFLFPMKIQGSKKSSGSRHCNITFIWQFRAIVYISLFLFPMKIQGSKKSSGSRDCNITFIWQFSKPCFLCISYKATSYLCDGLPHTFSTLSKKMSVIIPTKITRSDGCIFLYLGKRGPN